MTAGDADGDRDPEALQERIRELEARVRHLEAFLDENFPARWRTKASDEASDADAEPSATFSPLDEDEASRKAPARAGGSRGTLESRIGGNLLGKLGVLVLVLGLAFFVAYAIESGLIGLRARIVLGVVGGLAVWAGGHQLRDHANYGRLAQVFSGGGVALAYFSIFAAHHFDTYQALFGIGLLVDSLLLAILAAGVTVYSIQVKSSAFLLESLLLGFITAFLAADLTLFTLAYTTLMALGVSAAALLLRERSVAVLAILGTYAHATLTALVLEEHTTVLTAVSLDTVVFGIFAVLSTQLPHLAREAADEATRATAPAALYGLNAALALGAGTLIAETGDVLPDGRYPLLLGLALLGAAAGLWTIQRRTALVSALAGYAGLLLAAPLALEAQAFLMAWTIAYLALGLLNVADTLDEEAQTLIHPILHVSGILLLIATLVQTSSLEGMDRWVSLGSVALAYGITYAALARRREMDAPNATPSSEDRATGTLGIVPADRAPGLHLYAGTFILGLLLFVELTAIRITLALGLLGVALVAWGFLANWPEPRWAGLAVLGLALAKAFLYDVWQLTLGLRVVAFVGLGLALVAAAIAYARYGDELNLGGS